MANPAEPFRLAGGRWCAPASAHSDVCPEARMDGSHFDTLVKALATTPLSRARVVQGLAASVTALAGMRLSGEPGAAKKQNEKKIRVCNCPSSDATLCKTQKKAKPKAKKLLRRNACAYRGRCQGVSGCATPGCTPSCEQKICGDNGCGGSCGTCGTGQVCAAGRCVSSCPGGQKVCAGNCIPSNQCCTGSDCPADQVCFNGSCDPCLPNNTNQACVSSQQCCGTASGVPAVCCQVSDSGRVCFDFLTNDSACAPSNECPPPPELENCVNTNETCVNGACV